jgi:hypothetical protein
MPATVKRTANAVRVADRFSPACSRRPPTTNPMNTPNCPSRFRCVMNCVRIFSGTSVPIQEFQAGTPAMPAAQ